MGNTRVQPVILDPVHRHHVHVVKNGSDCRCKTVPIEAMTVELFRRLVRGTYQHHAFIEHHLKQTPQNDRVTNVIDEQLVETQHFQFFGQALGQRLERVGSADQLKQTLMNPLHEVMKMLAPGGHPQTLIELIHQPGLAPTHRPP